MLTQGYLRQRLHYDPDTGIFTHLLVKSNRVSPGDVAGREHICGYRVIKIDGRGYLAHRLAWLYVYGYMPAFIDHENHNRSDNRIKNLAETTRGKNQKNQSRARDNRSGVTGVSQLKSGSWKARITVDGEVINLGTFNQKEFAVAARLNANHKFGFHPNHGN